MGVINLHLKVKGFPFYDEIISREFSLFKLLELLLVGHSEQPFYITD